VYIFLYIPSSFCGQVETEESVKPVLVEINCFLAEGGEGESELLDSKLIYILATTGSVVGFGNVWLFPSLDRKCGIGLPQKPC